MASKNVNIKLGANITDFQSKMKRAQKGFKKTATALKNIGKSMTMGVTAPLLAFAAASVKAFDTQAKAEAKLKTALKGNEKAYKSLTDQARELQKITTFGDEETIAAQSMLASMGLEEEAILRLTPLIQDMATAKGMDLSAAADLVAKSVGSSTNAMSRYGIEIEGAVGSSERLDSAIAGLSGQFEGQSEAAAKAGAGGLKQLQNSMGDLMETIGGLLMPILNTLVGWLQRVVDAWTNLDGGLKIAIVTFAGILAAIGPVVGIFGLLMTAIGFIASPIGIVVVAIAALAAALIYVADNFEALKEVGAMVFATLQNAVISFIQFLVINNPFALLIDGYNLVAEAFGKDKITFFDDVSDSLEGLKMKIPEVSTEFGSFSEAVSNAATKAKDALFGIGSSMGVGGGTTAQGSTAESSPTISTTGLDLEEMEEESEFIDTTYGDSLLALKEKMTALKDATKEFGLAMINDFAGSMASAVLSGENFLQSMKQIFVDMAKQIATMIIKAAILAGIFAMIPGMGAAQAAGGGATNFMGLLTGSLTGKASGGGVAGGTPYMVGEQGPELFMPGQSGTIIPNGNVGGGSVIPDVRISGSDLVLVFNKTLQEQGGVNI
tara:strand:+ start:4528 stop:6351 length:1824 start_codon:yes stop_codon:yes gene_type:complete